MQYRHQNREGKSSKIGQSKKNVAQVGQAQRSVGARAEQDGQDETIPTHFPAR